MPETICRIFQDRAQAERAASALRGAGYARVDLLAPEGAGEGGNAAAAGMLRRFDLPAADARRFAEMIGAGRAGVVVRPPFGMALRAAGILDAHNPVAGGEPAPEEPIEVWTDATPFSRWLGLPLLTKNPHVMDKLFGWPLTTRFQLFSESWFNWPLLSSFRLSERLRIPLLTRRPGPVTEGMGMPLLTRRPTIFERMGMPALTRDATPLSSLLKLPLLTKSPTPFSDSIGIRVKLIQPRAAR